MYTRDDAYEGMKNNVVAGTAARVAAYAYDPFNPIRVSVDHTHPSGTYKDNPTRFSRGLIGDELVASLSMVDKMFVSDVDCGDLQEFDESMPVTIFKLDKNIDYNKDYEKEVLKDGSLPKIP